MITSTESLLIGLHNGQTLDLTAGQEAKQKKIIDRYERISPLCFLIMCENDIDTRSYVIDYHHKQEWYQGQLY